MERFRCWSCVGTGYTLVGEKKPCPRCEGKGFTGDAMDYVRSEEERDRNLLDHYRQLYRDDEERSKL